MSTPSPLIDPAPRTFFGVPSRPDLDPLDRGARDVGTWIVTHFLSEIFDQPQGWPSP